MKKSYFMAALLMVNVWNFFAQDSVNLSEFQMSNNTSPAFQLLEETITDVHTPDNVKALAFHVQNNFGEALAIEIAPYFFINTKSKNRTYYKYIGVTKENDVLKQNPFSGFNTTTLSFAYLKKGFETIAGDNEHKTFSIGARTTILRFYNASKVYSRAEDIANALSLLKSPPNSIFEIQDEEERKAALNEFYENLNIEERFRQFQKTIKPIFKLDGAVAYSNLFVDNSLDAKTVNRFGSWLTGEFSLILNQDDEESKTNDYINLLFVARYVEDGFNAETTDSYTTEYYRDFGGKISLELGKFTLGYEYLIRNGSISSERSVGNISYALDKNISITGGFGKDFQIENNLLAIFGINWGLNLGDSALAIDN